MPLFSVEAIDFEGNKIKRTFDVPNEDILLSILESSGLTPLKIKKLPQIFVYLNLLRFFRRVKKIEIIEILDNLHLIVKSGLPINTGLMDLAKDAENSAIKEMLLDISFQVQGGIPLSKAVERYNKYFPSVVISLFKIGEETGTLDKTLKDAANHLRKIEELKGKAKQALIYPAFALTSILGAMIFWLTFVIPKIMEVFKSFGMELPLMTRVLILASDFTQQYIIYIIISIFTFVISILLFRRLSNKFRYTTDRILLKLPIVGLIVKNFNYAFFAEYIRLMIRAGLPLYQALNIIEKAIRNSIFKNAVKNSREGIEEGKSFSSSLKEQNIFPSFVIRMISIGEQTGSLDEQLGHIADYYYAKVDYISQNIAKMIEPIVIGILGVFLLVLVLGLIAPIYQLLSDISKMA